MTDDCLGRLKTASYSTLGRLNRTDLAVVSRVAALVLMRVSVARTLIKKLLRENLLARRSKDVFNSFSSNVLPSVATVKRLATKSQSVKWLFGSKSGGPSARCPFGYFLKRIMLMLQRSTSPVDQSWR